MVCWQEVGKGSLFAVVDKGRSTNQSYYLFPPAVADIDIVQLFVAFNIYSTQGMTDIIYRFKNLFA